MLQAAFTLVGFFNKSQNALLFHYAASTFSPDKAKPHGLLKRRFVSSRNPLSFAQSGDISNPSFILVSEGNYFSHYKNLERCFARKHKGHLNHTVSVPVCCFSD